MQNTVVLAETTRGDIAVFDAEITPYGDALELKIADGRRITLYPPVINKIAGERAKQQTVKLLKRVYGQPMPDTGNGVLGSFNEDRID